MNDTFIENTHNNSAPESIIRQLCNVEICDGNVTISSENSALLAEALPQICTELLRWRNAAKNRPFALALALRSEAIEARVDDARSVIRAPGPIAHKDLTVACQTLLRHSKYAAERNAAADVLKQIGQAA